MMNKKFNFAFTVATEVDCDVDNWEDLPHERIIASLRRLVDKLEATPSLCRSHVEVFDCDDTPQSEFDTHVFDSTQASEEGWGVFDVNSTGFLEIERDDESQVFDSDTQALEFVRSQAEEGSSYHASALELHYKSLASGPRPT